MGLLTPCSVPRGGFWYTMIVPGGEFLLLSSSVSERGEWFWRYLHNMLIKCVLLLCSFCSKPMGIVLSLGCPFSIVHNSGVRC